MLCPPRPASGATDCTHGSGMWERSMGQGNSHLIVCKWTLLISGYYFWIILTDLLSIFFVTLLVTQCMYFHFCACVWPIKFSHSFLYLPFWIHFSNSCNILLTVPKMRWCPHHCNSRKWVCLSILRTSCIILKPLTFYMTYWINFIMWRVIIISRNLPLQFPYRQYCYGCATCMLTTDLLPYAKKRVKVFWVPKQTHNVSVQCSR